MCLFVFLPQAALKTGDLCGFYYKVLFIAYLSFHMWLRKVACIPQGLRRDFCVPHPQLPSPLSGLRSRSFFYFRKQASSHFVYPASLRALHMVSFLLHSAAHYTLSFSYPALFQVCILFPLKDTDTSHNGFQVGNMKLKTFLHFPPPHSLLPLCIY